MAKKCNGQKCRGLPPERRQDATANLHACPYREEIGDDPTPSCDCCNACEGECRDDI